MWMWKRDWCSLCKGSAFLCRNSCPDKYRHINKENLLSPHTNQNLITKKRTLILIQETTVLLLSFVDCFYFFTRPIRIEKWVFISQKRKKCPWDLHTCKVFCWSLSVPISCFGKYTSVLWGDRSFGKRGIRMRCFHLLKGPQVFCSGCRGQEMMMFAVSLSSQVRDPWLPAARCRDNCTMFSFGGFNDYITHIYISFLIGHLEENLFAHPPMLQFSSWAIFFKEHSLGQNVFEALRIFTKLSVQG